MASDVCVAAPSQLTVDLGAIRANWRALAERTAPATCAAVIKADAYGLGARRVGAALYREGCRTFFVAHLSEALDVQSGLGPDSTIYILNGLDPACEDQCAARGFIPVLNSASQIARWRALARRTARLPAALQIDSGMSRFGLSPHDAMELADDTSFGADVELRLLLSHLACADAPDNSANETQLARFNTVRALFPDVPASLANSSGIFLGADYHHDVVRPGLALYGAMGPSTADILRPAVGLDARVVQVRDIPAGAGVGYGLDYVAPASRRIATIGMGYADGWPRSMAGRGAVWFREQRLPLLGRISMDSFSIDVTSLGGDAPQEGDFVELFGARQSITDAAQDAGTIAHEMLTLIGRRHQRVYREGETSEIEAPGGWR